jgi:beta-glucosidase-like glycosyl hydrolase
MIREGRVSGVILFDRNAGTRRAVRRLTAELQSIPRPPAVDRPLLVTVDQEGGWSAGCRARRTPPQTR